MNRFDDFPYSQIREACGTVIGRVGLVVFAALLGSMLGGLTATRSLSGLWLGFVGLPGFSLASILYGLGLFVLPALLVYAIVSVRLEWPLKLTAVCVLLMWLNIHRTIRWTLYDSPMAKVEQQIQAEFDHAVENATKKGEVPNSKPANTLRPYDTKSE